MKPISAKPKTVGLLGHHFLLTDLDGTVRGECVNAANAKRFLAQGYGIAAWQLVGSKGLANGRFTREHWRRIA